MDDITATQGYSKLASKVNELGFLLKLEEKAVEGDDVDSFYELDEYVNDFPRYYVVTVSGW